MIIRYPIFFSKLCFSYEQIVNDSFCSGKFLEKVVSFWKFTKLPPFSGLKLLALCHRKLVAAVVIRILRMVPHPVLPDGGPSFDFARRN